MKRFYFYYIFFFFISPSSLFAQEQKTLPNGLTNSEKALITNFEFRNSQITPPPSTPVRTMAEWEEVEYIVVSWDDGFKNILRQIVDAAVKECKVLIVTRSQSSVSSYLSSNGVDTTNVRFLNANSDTIWMRDYAGNTIYSNDIESRGLTDWIYNRPRPNDDVVPTAYANLLNIPIYVTDSGTNDLVNTGGNFMTDGLGNGFSSDLVLNENEQGNPYGVSVKDEDQIDDIMFNYMGIDNYIKMRKLIYDQISHIDMHMKLLDEETILVSRYPDGVADGPRINQNINYILNNFSSHFGTPYKIEWIDAPPGPNGDYPDNGGFYRTYSNSIIINKTILIPTYREQYDAPAIAKYKEMMPGYTIVGIDVDNANENLISLVGAIHCITHSIGVEDPLWIVHQPVEQAITSIPISAMIKHNSGVSNASVFWKAEGDTTFNELAMSGNGDTWTTDITIPGSVDKINYYISAEANSGKQLNRPIVAPEGFWTVDTSTLSAEEWAQNNITGPYPNPTKENISFRLNTIDGPIEISIINVLGQELFKQEIENANGEIELALKQNWNGTLFVKFKGHFGEVTKKIIKL